MLTDDEAEAVNRAIPGADALLAALTCWKGVQDLVVRERGGFYCPLFRQDLDARYARCAEIFNAAMAEIGDSRRATVVRRFLA